MSLLWRLTGMVVAVAQFLAVPPYMAAAVIIDGSTLPAASSPASGGTRMPATPAPILVNKTLSQANPVPSELNFTFPVDDAEISASHVLTGILEPIGGNTSQAENDALARALSKLAKDRRDWKSLDGFVSAYPNSPWMASVLTNLGHFYLHSGYYSKALEAWRKAWVLAQNATQYPQTMVADRAAEDDRRGLV